MSSVNVKAKPLKPQAFTCGDASCFVLFLTTLAQNRFNHKDLCAMQTEALYIMNKQG